MQLDRDRPDVNVLLAQLMGDAALYEWAAQ